MAIIKTIPDIEFLSINYFEFLINGTACWYAALINWTKIGDGASTVDLYSGWN
jgi:hypothetical protein